MIRFIAVTAFLGLLILVLAPEEELATVYTALELDDLSIGNDNLTKTLVLPSGAPTSSSGTAFSINSNGYWLTSAHVVANCKNVYLTNDAENLVYVDNVVILKNYDIALLKSELVSPSFSLSNMSSDTAYFTGFSAGKINYGSLIFDEQTVVYDINDESKRLASVWSVFSINDKQSILGLSGSPLLDQHGHVVGVLNSANSEKFIATPLTVVMRFLQATGKKRIGSESKKQKNVMDLKNLYLNALNNVKYGKIKQVICSNENKYKISRNAR